MYKIMQHCFGKDNSGGPINAFNRLLTYSKNQYSTLRQLEPAGGINLVLLIKFIYEIKQAKPTLIHVRGLGNEGFHAALAAKIANVPIILLSIHGTHRDLTSKYNPIRRFIVVNILEKITLNLATDVVTVSEVASRREFLSKYSYKLKTPIPNGVPIPSLIDINTKNEIRKSLGISSEEIVAICVSRVTKEKGFLVLAKALKLIDNPALPFTLLIVGGSDDPDLFKRAFSGLKYIKIEFIGHVKDVNRFLSISDLFIFPSLHENLSNALLEALSFSLPVIATNVGGNTEVLKQGGGVLVEKNSHTELAEVITTLIEDTQLRVKHSNQARENIIKNYSIDKMVQQWEDLYQDLLEKYNNVT